MNELQKEISRRRTFAIISHPDAGKTTLTEKLLLYGGAIQLAGSVKARRNQRKATSDWMELEKERGISVTSTVLQFEYQGHVLNLLDTPGHNDFSADTYRTLTAADSAVMLIDNAKGVEAQTKKLFAVCRERGVPIFTFVNKMDFPGRGPLTLLEEVEEVLGIQSVAVNWPIGQGDEFRGIYDRESKRVHLFSRTAHGASRAEEDVYDLEDPRLPGILGEDVLETLRQEIDLIDIAGEALNMERVLKGDLTPVFFGSALTNFGVQPFLDRFLTMAPPPGERESKEQAVATDAPFSGFVFKIQANMDPQHRDRVAFLRVVSGKFEKDMQVIHTRTGKPIRLTRPQRLFASDRETMDEAYAGDIIGLPNPGAFILGDTLSLNPKDAYDEVPPFVPESFATLLNMDVSRHKHFEKGIVQLTEEGLVDLFWDPRSQRREPVLGAVGRLQFDVVQFRMLSEYGVKTALEPVQQTAIRWVVGDLSNPILSIGAKVYEDSKGRPVILANLDRQFDYIESKNPGLKLYRTAMLDKQHGVATGL